MRRTSLRARSLEVLRAITRVAGLSWKMRANQFWAERGRRGRGFWVFLGAGALGGVSVEGLDSAGSGSGWFVSMMLSSR